MVGLLLCKIIISSLIVFGFFTVRNKRLVVVSTLLLLSLNYLLVFTYFLFFSDISVLNQSNFNRLEIAKSFGVVALYGYCEMLLMAMWCIVRISRLNKIFLLIIVLIIWNAAATLRWDQWDWRGLALVPFSIVREPFIDLFLIQFPRTHRNFEGLLLLLFTTLIFYLVFKKEFYGQRNFRDAHDKNSSKLQP